MNYYRDESGYYGIEWNIREWFTPNSISGKLCRRFAQKRTEKTPAIRTRGFKVKNDIYRGRKMRKFTCIIWHVRRTNHEKSRRGGVLFIRPRKSRWETINEKSFADSQNGEKRKSRRQSAAKLSQNSSSIIDFASEKLSSFFFIVSDLKGGRFEFAKYSRLFYATLYYCRSGFICIYCYKFNFIFNFDIRNLSIVYVRFDVAMNKQWNNYGKVICWHKFRQRVIFDVQPLSQDWWLHPDQALNLYPTILKYR